MRGRLIVIEGGDGAGKATQTGLLREYLKEQKIPSASITFPQYKGTIFCLLDLGRRWKMCRTNKRS